MKSRIDDFVMPKELMLPCDCSQGDETPHHYEHTFESRAISKYRCEECHIPAYVPVEHLRAYTKEQEEKRR